VFNGVPVPFSIRFHGNETFETKGIALVTHGSKVSAEGEREGIFPICAIGKIRRSCRMRSHNKGRRGGKEEWFHVCDGGGLIPSSWKNRPFPSFRSFPKNRASSWNRLQSPFRPLLRNRRFPTSIPLVLTLPPEPKSTSSVSGAPTFMFPEASPETCDPEEDIEKSPLFPAEAFEPSEDSTVVAPSTPTVTFEPSSVPISIVPEPSFEIEADGCVSGSVSDTVGIFVSGAPQEARRSDAARAERRDF
jgi:hypothetical protein